MESPSFRWSRLASNPYPSRALYLACADGRKGLAKDATESAVWVAGPPSGTVAGDAQVTDPGARWRLNGAPLPWWSHQSGARSTPEHRRRATGGPLIWSASDSVRGINAG